MAAVQSIPVPAQPDIQYHPDFDKYKERTHRRKETETLQDSVPVGFPQKLTSPLVWEGKDIEKRDDWIYHLSDAQLDEIDKGLQSFKGAFAAISRIFNIECAKKSQRATFPWGTSPTLHSLYPLFAQSFEISPRRFIPAEASSFFGDYVSITTLQRITSSFMPVCPHTLATSEDVSRIPGWRTALPR